MKRSWKIVISILCGIIVVACAGWIKLFLIGDLMSVDQIPIRLISVSDSRIELTGEMMPSALAYRGYKYRIDGDALYVKVYSVLVSPFHRYGTVRVVIDGDFLKINAIYLDDAEKQKLIWLR